VKRPFPRRLFVRLIVAIESALGTSGWNDKTSGWISDKKTINRSLLPIWFCPDFFLFSDSQRVAKRRIQLKRSICSIAIVYPRYNYWGKKSVRMSNRCRRFFLSLNSSFSHLYCVCCYTTLLPFYIIDCFYFLLAWVNRSVFQCTTN